ncbi:hypothetical protein [Actinoplanes sp. RD1]|uniref:hypothetical protein n=1 Tax=Actinoplanes sp. RD1 TaxID=3064538 RepID=UPI0027404101|nr:hypothetical protein [Actinoplanes sp. RD1]
MSVDEQEPDATQIIRAREPAISVDGQEPDATRIIFPGDRTQIIVPGEQTQIIVPGEQTQVIDAGGRTTRIRIDTGVPASTAVPRQRRGRRSSPPGPARPPGAPESPELLRPGVSADPLDELVDRMRPRLAKAVDELQVAAALEAEGLTDRIARVAYGFSDVFALALQVYRRLGPPAQDGPAPVLPRRDRRESVRVLAHGPLYALPAAVFPAVLVVLDPRAVVLAVTVAGALGWVYAGTAAFAAYKLLGSWRPRAASRLLLFAALVAPALGAVAGVLIMLGTGGGWGLVLLAAGQLTYQLAGTIFMFHRREGLQAALMVPAVVGGIAYLVVGAQAGPVAIGTAVAGVTAAFGVSLWLTRGRGDDGEPPALPLLRHRAAGLGGITAYGACSAALLLHAEAPYLPTRLDLAVAVAPLILAMGFVEWRAEGFRAQAVLLTHRYHAPSLFQQALWRAIRRETVACLLVPAGLGLGLAAVLGMLGRLTPEGLFLIAAHVALAGAYYVAFLLAGFERFGLLCGAMLAALALHVGVGAVLGAAPLLGMTGRPVTDTTLYLVSVLALHVLFLIGLSRHVGQVRHYR